MRQAGEISRTLLQAVKQLTTEERAPTLRELVDATGFSMREVRQRVHDMTRYGHIAIPRTRVVSYRNRPVAEYGLPLSIASATSQESSGFAVLAQAWG